MTSFKWATVTAVGPLRVRFDGDATALAFTPDSLVDPAALSVDDRVRCELSDRRVVIHGAAGGVPDVGDVKMTALSAARAGWLLCNGSAVSRTTYSALFAGIGTTYGAGDGSATFNLPDMRGRVPVGRDSGQSEFDVLGEAGGAKTVSHSHTLSDDAHAQIGSGSSYVSREITVPTYTFSKALGGAFASSNTYTKGVPLRGSTDTTTPSVLQPYRVLNFIIKT